MRVPENGMVRASLETVRILVISPHATERTALEELLRMDGHDVHTASNRIDGLAAMAAGYFEVIIADTQVPGLDGVALLRQLAAFQPRRVILLCARANRVIERHGVVCLTKPVELADLLRYVELAPVPLARTA